MAIDREYSRKLFLRLLRAGLWERDIRSFPDVDDDIWNEILSEARRQTVVGLIYRGVSHLGENVAVPDGVEMSLMLESDRIQRSSAKVVSAAGRIVSLLKKGGFHPIVMKGPSVARLYKEPSLRSAGDVDLYLDEGEFDSSVDYLKGHGVEISSSPDGSADYYIEGICIDQHRRYFDIHGKDGLLPKVPSVEAELLMLSSHILKHVMGHGVGLRQMCDMAIAYKAYEGSYDHSALESLYDSLGLLYWNRMLYSFLRKNLGLDVTLFEGKKEVKCSHLEKIVFEGGNMGFHSGSRHLSESRSAFSRKMRTALSFARNIPFNLRVAPGEFVSLVWELAKGNVGD